MTGVTGCITMLNYTNEQAIFFTVYEDSAHFLCITRLLTLAPDLIARSTEKVCIACLTCTVKGFFVHEGHHQYLVSGVILDHSGYKSLAIKLQHGLFPDPPFLVKWGFFLKEGFTVLSHSSWLRSNNGNLLAIMKKLASLHNGIARTEYAQSLFQSLQWVNCAGCMRQFERADNEATGLQTAVGL